MTSLSIYLFAWYILHDGSPTSAGAVSFFGSLDPANFEPNRSTLDLPAIVANSSGICIFQTQLLVFSVVAFLSHQTARVGSHFFENFPKTTVEGRCW
jgi:hypothetical protein